MECILFAIVYENAILLQLRDSIDTIKYPDYWAITGGAMEVGETPYEALKRELLEEIVCVDKSICDYNVSYCGKFENEWHNFEYLFLIIVDTQNITCIEGKESKFWNLFDLPEKIPPHHKKALNIIKALYNNHCSKSGEVISKIK